MSCISVLAAVDTASENRHAPSMALQTFTRRETGTMFLSAAVASASSAPAFAAGGFGQQLERDLNSRFLPGAEGLFTVIGFGSARVQGKVAMAAVVRLDWPPGWRSRRLDVVGDTPQDAYDQLFNTSLL